MDGPTSQSTRQSRPLTATPLLNHAATALGRPLHEHEIARLGHYVDLLLDANSRLNLTAIRDREGMERRHILETLALTARLESLSLLTDGSEVIDVGSGGGVPGIPLAIVRSDVRITLLEATGKKAAFLRDTVGALGLVNVTVVAARAEEVGQELEHRERYHLALARAVAPLDTLSELTLPLVRVGGHVVAVKGARVWEELEHGRAAALRCGGQVQPVVELPSPKAEPSTLVIIAKVAPTPPELPRRPGMPAKRPLR